MKSSNLESRLTLCVLSAEIPERGIGHLDLVRAAISGGAPCVQLRVKDKSSREFYNIACQAQSACAHSGTFFVVNDRIDIALAVRADGVHLGQSDLPLKTARRLMGKDAIIGISASTYEEAVVAASDGADYIGFGPIFPTYSKDDAAPPSGLDVLVRVTEALDIPIVAIGGIEPEKIEDVLEAGADGVAVISAIAMALRPQAQVGFLMQKIKDWQSKE